MELHICCFFIRAHIRSFSQTHDMNKILNYESPLNKLEWYGNSQNESILSKGRKSTKDMQIQFFGGKKSYFLIIKKDFVHEYWYFVIAGKYLVTSTWLFRSTCTCNYMYFDFKRKDLIITR